MTIQDGLKARIGKELKEMRGGDGRRAAGLAFKGEQVAARADLMYFSAGAEFPRKLAETLSALRLGFTAASDEARQSALRFLTYLAVDLNSFTPAWRLAGELGGWPKAVKPIEAASDAVFTALVDLAALDRRAEQRVIAEIDKDSTARLKAEGLSDEKRIAREVLELTLGGLAYHARRLIAEAGSSNLLTAARAKLAGKLDTELGNDYAAFLPLVVWMGGSFVTTNPVLIKLAWDIDPELWNRRVNQLIAGRYARGELSAILDGPAGGLTEAIEGLNALITVSVVEQNCRLLRPIFLLSGGATGYVSMQVNPKNHNDGARMVVEATAMYKELERRLGGVPNVVIKVPSTAAGLYAAEKLTQAGIGVTVTLTFSLFQGLEFAKVLNRGSQLVSYIAIMNGRLAFPVRDELKNKNAAGGVEAARWAGVEIARKSNRRYYDPPARGGLGADPAKVKIMIASLRIYGDWMPDISELWGIPNLTVFPNVRRSFDAHARAAEFDSVRDETPLADLAVLGQSELFRQAWWTPEDGTAFKPGRVLTLQPADAPEVAGWQPVAETLKQFIGMYEEMSGMVQRQMRAVAKGEV